MIKLQRCLRKLLPVLYLLILLGIVYLLVRLLAPIHETFHALPCKIAGISPAFSYFRVDCPGIAEKSYFMQFFYFMGPYIFYFILALLGYFYSRRYKIIKYLLLIPLFDILFNYIYTLRRMSDFYFLLVNTNVTLFVVGMLVVLFITGLIFLVILPARIWSYNTFEGDWLPKRWHISKD